MILEYARAAEMNRIQQAAIALEIPRISIRSKILRTRRHANLSSKPGVGGSSPPGRANYFNTLRRVRASIPESVWMIL
jgi:hypothetical protein